MVPVHRAGAARGERTPPPEARDGPRGRREGSSTSSGTIGTVGTMVPVGEGEV